MSVKTIQHLSYYYIINEFTVTVLCISCYMYQLSEYVEEDKFSHRPSSAGESVTVVQVKCPNSGRGHNHCGTLYHWSCTNYRRPESLVDQGVTTS